MGKMKKLAALFLAAAMTMSLGMTALANPSQVDPDIPNVTDPVIPDETKLTALDKDGNRITVTQKEISKEVQEILKDENKVKDIFETAGFAVSDNMQFVFLGGGDLKVDNMPEGGIEIPLSTEGYDVKPGDIVYAIHQKSDGTWEVIPCEVGRDGVVRVTLTSLSPVAIIKVLSDGKIVVLDEKKNIVGEVKDGKTVPVTKAKTSPKTGA